MLKAETVDSKESRAHLEDARDRIMSIATVQQQLDPIGLGGEIEVAGYLAGLCKSLARSRIGGRKPITLTVEAGEGTLMSDRAVSIGLMTTELVIDCSKHAFAAGQVGKALVTYTAQKKAWTLSVSGDGMGQSLRKPGQYAGLGTSIMEALAAQMHSEIRTESSSRGTKVSVIHACA